MKKSAFSTAAIMTFLLTLIAVDNAYAVPSFARQTGLDCMACHTAFPELTQMGRDFKLRGYTMGGGETKMPLPLAAMVMADATNIAKSKNANGDYMAANSNGQDRNNELVVPQVSLFYGGKIYGNLGMFMQVTYDGTNLPQDKGVATNTAMDNTDIRYADSKMIADKELIYGVTLNNNPSVQDIWNSTSAWGFPYASSAVAPAPSASTLLDGGLSQMVAGLSAYAMWNDMIYVEAGAYQTAPKNGVLSFLGWNNGGANPVVHGNAPYGRIALQHDFGDHYLMVGSSMMTTSVKQDGTDKLDTHHDWSVDAEYQYNYDKHYVTATASKIWEKANLDASQFLGNADNSSDSITTTKVKASYYYDHKYGASLGYVTTSGNVDVKKYTDSANGSPDSSYSIAEFDYLPISQVKFSLSYTMYDKFNGAKTNYDNAGRNASDNNTLYLVGWFMF